MRSIDLQTQVQRAAVAFRARFGRSARFAAIAPGRVNLIGDHTDYNGGLVLPMALGLRTVMVGDRAEGRRVRVISTLQDAIVAIELDESAEPGETGWGGYVRGVVAGAALCGLDPGGFDAVVDSSVPPGAGLSSSAALTMAVATFVEALAGGEMAALEKAQLCQQAERDYAGVPCGLMDPFIAVVGRQDHAALIDCRAETYRLVSLDRMAVCVLVVDSGVRRDLGDGRYALRRRQCEAAAAALQVDYLCDATMAALIEAAAVGLDEALHRRARHVLTENERTGQAAEALDGGHYRRCGELMSASHASLRDDFQVSCPELDLLVALAGEIGAEGGMYGARMTGGGFGGCVVCLARTDSAMAACDWLRREYAARTGMTPSCLIARPSGGARMLPL